MFGSALIVIAAFAATGAAGVALALASRRRRSRRASGRLGARLDPAPAGVKALASSVSDLSDLRVHLASRVPSSARKAKLGVLLGLR